MVKYVAGEDVDGIQANIVKGKRAYCTCCDSELADEDHRLVESAKS